MLCLNLKDIISSTVVTSNIMCYIVILLYNLHTFHGLILELCAIIAQCALSSVIARLHFSVLFFFYEL